MIQHWLAFFIPQRRHFPASFEFAARTFDGRPVAGGHIGPLTARLRQALFEDLGLDLAAQARSYAERIDA